MITDINKHEIKILVEKYAGKYESQAKAVASLKGVSEATFINIKKQKWDAISPAMWQNVAKQVGWNMAKNPLVETMDFMTMCTYFDIAKEYSATFAIVGGSGFGKTFTGEWYTDKMKGKNVFHIRCGAHLNKKYFLHIILLAIGCNPIGYNTFERLQMLVDSLRKMEKPLIIIDEIDKLEDNVLSYFITLYNDLDGLCGFVWTSTKTIERRIISGLEKKKGYKELYSRIGRKFIELVGTDHDEVKELCLSRGIVNIEEVNTIYNEFEGDIRRIDRAHLKELVKAKRANKKEAA